MRSILVTGDRGFLGSHLVRHLEDLEFLVVGCDLVAGMNAAHDAAMYPPEHHADLKAVIHLAAQTQVGWCWKNASDAFANNVGALCGAIEIAAMHNVPLIVSTTDKVYDPTCGYANEHAPLRGGCPYSASKVVCEHLLDNYRPYATHPVVAVRCGNLIGPDDHNSQRLFPAIRNAHWGKAPMPFINGKCLRQWIHVQDACDAIVCILGAVLRGEEVSPAYNVAGLQAVSVQEIVDLFANEGIVVTSEKHHADFKEATSLLVNSDLMRERFGWEPKITIEQAVAEAAAAWRDK